MYCKMKFFDKTVKFFETPEFSFAETKDMAPEIYSVKLYNSNGRLLYSQKRKIPLSIYRKYFYKPSPEVAENNNN